MTKVLLQLMALNLLKMKSIFIFHMRERKNSDISGDTVL